MRLVEGQDLKGLIREEGRLEPARALAILSQVADALDAAHARGLVHRDVKPSNVLLDEGEHAYLADFGLTRRVEDRKAFALEARSLGTIDYVAPEQIQGEDVDGRADVYALGCVLYECLAGAPPFRRASDAATLYAHLEESTPALAGLDAVMTKALAKSPVVRYATCGELVADARRALGIAEPQRARWPLAVAGVGAALIGAALLAFFLTKGDGGVTPDPAADSLLHIDAKTNEVVDTMPVGRKASAVSVGDGFVWVANSGDGTVWRITPGSGLVLKLPVHATPTDIAVTRGQALVVNGPQGSVEAFDARTGVSSGVTQLTAPGPGAVLVSSSGKDVWFGAPNDQRIGNASGEIVPTGPTVGVRIAPDRRSLLASYRAFNGLAVGLGAVWVTGDPFGRYVWRVDRGTREVVATIPIPSVPYAIATGAESVWVTSLLDDKVFRIDPESNRVTTAIAVPRGAYSIAIDAGAVWVIGSLDRTLTRIDPATNRVTAQIPLGNTPIDVAADGDDVWVVEGAR